MKNRFLSLLLACILCLNLGSIAYARTWSGGETINDSENGPRVEAPSDTGGGTTDDNNNSSGDDKTSDDNNSGGDDKTGDNNKPSGDDKTDGDNNPSGGDKPGDDNPGTINPPDNRDNEDDDNDRRINSGSSSSSSSDTTTTSIQPTGATTPTEPITQTEPDTGRTASTFSDVPSHEWYYQAVTYVSTNGIMSGNGNRFAPSERLTRGMMAQILYNLEKAEDTGAATFPDVTDSDWFAKAAAWASSQGFMSGYSNGSFGANDDITREQLAVILYRYAAVKGYDVFAKAELFGFADGGTTADWAAEAMRWAVGSGLLSGKTGVVATGLDPTGTATRAEVAQIFTSFLTKIAK